MYGRKEEEEWRVEKVRGGDFSPCMKGEETEKKTTVRIYKSSASAIKLQKTVRCHLKGDWLVNFNEDLMA